jgi:hypothetical protein
VNNQNSSILIEATIPCTEITAPAFYDTQDTQKITEEECTGHLPPLIVNYQRTMGKNESFAMSPQSIRASHAD